MAIQTPETDAELKAMEGDFENALASLDAPPPAATETPAPAPAAAAPATTEPSAPATQPPTTPPTTPPAEPPTQPTPPATVDLEKIKTQADGLRKAAEAFAPSPVAPVPQAPAPAATTQQPAPAVTPAEAPPPEQPKPQPRAELKDPLEELSAEEKQALSQFGEDWPDVNNAMGIHSKVFTGRVALLMHAYNQHVMAQISELRNMVAQVTGTIVNTTLQNNVPDYNQLRTDVAAWVAQIPDAFRPPYQQALDSGDPVKFLSLVEQYQKSATTMTPPTQTPPSSRQVRPPPSGAHLAPVSERRGAMATVADPNDEDGAFAEALRAANGR